MNAWLYWAMHGSCANFTIICLQTGKTNSIALKNGQDQKVLASGEHQTPHHHGFGEDNK
jgi:hypothetical protein